MIVRRRRTKNFTILENEVLDDDRLSLEAMGLLAWLRSRPDDWQLQVEHLRDRFKVGRDKMHGLVRELVAAGWIRRERKRDETTKSFVGMEYVVLDEASAPDDEPDSNDLGKKPRPENPDVAPGDQDRLFSVCAEPHPGLPGPANPDVLIRTDSNQELSHTPLPPPPRHEEGVGGSILDQVTIRAAAPEPPPARWHDLAAIWPWEDGESRIQAEALFEALDRPTRRHVMVAAPAYLRAIALGPRSKRCHLKTFIGQQLFRDYPDDGEVPRPRPKLVFIAVGTPEFAAWDRAYRDNGKPGMPSSSQHNGRHGWWRETPFPPAGWKFEPVARPRDGPSAAA